MLPGRTRGDTGRFVRPRRGFEPAYLRAFREDGLRGKLRQAAALLGPACRVCPRACRQADRSSGKAGLCGVGRLARVASSGCHVGEERVVRGTRGSGTIFFSRCNLRCVFCQNADISRGPHGDDVDTPALAETMVRLQDVGCHNINLVSPSHVVPQVVEALALAAARGLRLPLVYNSGGYDSLEALDVLDGLVDVYMPDFKVWGEEAAGWLLGARDYPSVARRAIIVMRRQVGDLTVDEHGVALRGLLVRHLVMPGMAEDSGRILGWLGGLSRDVYVNIMEQYHPAAAVPRDPGLAALNRRPTRAELDGARTAALQAGLWRLARD